MASQVKNFHRKSRFALATQKFFQFVGYMVSTLLITGILVHFFKAGDVHKGWDQLVFIGRFYSSPEQFKEIVQDSFRDLEHDFTYLDSLDVDNVHKDSLYDIVHTILGEYLDPRSKRVVSMIVERRDLDLLEKIKYAEEELQKDMYSFREKEVFQEKFAEISKLFFVLSNEGNDAKLEACSHIIKMESFNPMYHYSAIRSIIEFTFNFVDEKNIGRFTKELLLERAYSDHKLVDWEIRGFNLLQAEEVDSAFLVFEKHIDWVEHDPSIENAEQEVFRLISRFITQLNENDYGVFRKEYPEEVEAILIRHLEWLYTEFAKSAETAHEKLEVFEFLVEISHFDIRYFKEHSQSFNNFAYALYELPVEEKVPIAQELKEYFATLKIDVHEIDRDYFVGVMDKIINDTK